MMLVIVEEYRDNLISAMQHGTLLFGFEESDQV
jgi:hypothetical protein